jgi:hypothetical protein
MVRYLIRRGSTGEFWMVWDREKRGPAMIGDRALVRLTQEQAELALVGLTGQVRPSKDPLNYITWEVIYGAGTTVPCTHEVDAKLLARELIKRATRFQPRQSRVYYRPDRLSRTRFTVGWPNSRGFSSQVGTGAAAQRVSDSGWKLNLIKLDVVRKLGVRVQHNQGAYF